MFFILSRAWEKENKKTKTKKLKREKKRKIVTNEIKGVKGFMNAILRKR